MKAIFEAVFKILKDSGERYGVSEIKIVKLKENELTMILEDVDYSIYRIDIERSEAVKIAKTILLMCEE